MRHCPRCGSEISNNDKSCSRCGLAVDKMEEFTKNFTYTDESLEKSEGQETENQEQEVISKKEQKKRDKAEKKAKKKADKKAREEAIKNEDTQFFKFATNSGEENPDEILEGDTYLEKRKKKKRQAAKPVFQIDENGEFHIATKDVEIVGEETGNIIKERYEQSYSVKKERGDYTPPKIKWWEIYKLADKHFVRRKVKKEVNKAAKVKPKFVKKSKLLLLSIFLGWCGSHNFYARNKKKGWVALISFAICIFVNALAGSSKFFSSIQISIGGGFGFVFLFMWIADIINISTNQYKFKIQRDKFIALLNVETRAKLGEKYIDLDLYHKPWWVRFKVWLEKTKRNYEEYKRDKRQRNIDKEKRRLAAQEEKEKIERDIAEVERRENEELKAKKNPTANAEEVEEVEEEIVSKQVLDELKSFGESDEDAEEVEEDEEDIENEDEITEQKVVKKGGSQNYSNKYAKFASNKKNKKKKKK